MKELTFETIKDLRTAIDKGLLKEKDIEIILDNDNVSFYLKNGTEDDTEIEVQSACGYGDIEELYKLVFLQASVSWC